MKLQEQLKELSSSYKSVFLPLFLQTILQKHHRKKENICIKTNYNKYQLHL